MSPTVPTMPAGSAALDVYWRRPVNSPYYEDDLVTLYHGDCREVTEWLTADVLVTDPPYGISWEQKTGDNAGPRRRVVRARGVLSGDDDTSMRDAALAAWGGRPALVFGSWRMPRPIGIHALLIWHKEGAYSGISAGPFFTNHEEVYVIGRGWRTDLQPLRSVITTTEHRSAATGQIGHPTPKPVGLMERLLERCPVGVVADPFAGSGSTLLASKLSGRRAIGVELKERYCELAAKRLAQDALFGGAA